MRLSIQSSTGGKIPAGAGEQPFSQGRGTDSAGNFS